MISKHLRIHSLIVLLSVGGMLSNTQAEWVSLFDGKSLDGWTKKNGWAEYRIEDGAIVGKSVDKSPNTFLATEKQYGDFVLELEVKVDTGLNSGIQFRSQSFPGVPRRPRVHGYQYELDTAQRRWTAGIYDEARRGWLYPVDLNPKAKPLYKPDAWNKVRIECVGNSLRTWLNDKPVSHLIDDLTPTVDLSRCRCMASAAIKPSSARKSPGATSASTKT